MADSIKTETEAEGLNLKELRKKYIGKRFCIFRGIDRGLIGKCRWIEERTFTVPEGTFTVKWYRIEVDISDGYYTQKKSYWASESDIIRIQDEPDEVPYYSGW